MSHPCTPLAHFPLQQVRQGLLSRAPLPSTARPAVSQPPGCEQSTCAVRWGPCVMSIPPPRAGTCPLSNKSGITSTGPSTNAKRWTTSGSATPATGALEQDVIAGWLPPLANGRKGCIAARSWPISRLPSFDLCPCPVRRRTDPDLQELHRRFPWVCVW